MLVTHINSIYKFIVIFQIWLRPIFYYISLKSIYFRLSHNKAIHKLNISLHIEVQPILAGCCPRQCCFTLTLTNYEYSDRRVGEYCRTQMTVMFTDSLQDFQQPDSRLF